MELKLEMVPVEKLVDAYSGVSMMDSTQTIMNGLTQLELDRYGKAVDKIEKGQILNVKDLKVLDKIDAMHKKDNEPRKPLGFKMNQKK